MMMLGPNTFSLSSGRSGQGRGGGFRINCVNSLARKGSKARRFECVCVGVGGMEGR
jgi:hypothetical protein